MSEQVPGLSGWLNQGEDLNKGKGVDDFHLGLVGYWSCLRDIPWAEAQMSGQGWRYINGVYA